jgi:asparagine synthase (glutamine-hydrolysing)
MCGVCGVVSFEGRDLDPAVGRRMLESLHHRGPDDRGAYSHRVADTAIFLGHTRLSILDLSAAGRQPLSNETGSVWVSFNGEIYNFKDLRAELEAHGHQFRSKTDSEVIVHAYEQFGDECVRRLDGMFAFALWDQDRERLLLARDRAGKKPLFYWSTPSEFVFGSEIKAILAHPAVPRELDPEAIPPYFTLGYVPSPATFYQHVFQVPPGSYLVVEKSGVRAPVAYWDLPIPKAGEERDVPEEEAAREVRRLLEAAVARRLISDVPLGAFLSGGIDSSIVVGLMSRFMGRPVKTFCIGFTGDPEFDETPFARVVAKHFRTDHTEFIVDPKSFDLVDTLLWHHDQPYGDSSAIPTYLLAKLTREHVTVALTGDGGDELFAGYERFLAARVTEWMPKPLVTVGLACLDALPRMWRSGRGVTRASRLLRPARTPLPERYLTWCSLFSPDLVAQLLRSPPSRDIRRSFDGWFERTREVPLINRLLYLNFKTYLPDDLLVKMDRMSMAHALETRSPFLDTALIEYVASLPGPYKLKGMTLKYLLKRAVADLLPAEIQNRGKRGFGVPLGAWFRKELREPVEDLLLAGSPHYRQYLRQETVEQVIRDHQNRVRDCGAQLWALVNFEAWLKGLSSC